MSSVLVRHHRHLWGRRGERFVCAALAPGASGAHLKLFPAQGSCGNGLGWVVDGIAPGHSPVWSEHAAQVSRCSLGRRIGALQNVSPRGFHNGVGPHALQSLPLGGFRNGLGQHALQNLPSDGFRNGLGPHALQNLPSDGFRNGLGPHALQILPSGGFRNGLGPHALQNVPSGGFCNGPAPLGVLTPHPCETCPPATRRTPRSHHLSRGKRFVCAALPPGASEAHMKRFPAPVSIGPDGGEGRR